MEVRRQELTRYILPLREGGSLPGLAEADDGFRYAVKFKGGGHGAKSLISELVGGLVAKALKFKTPELVFLNLSPLFGITEPDQEVQELLRKSEGTNLGLHFLDRAATFDPVINEVDPLFASKLVWLDAFLTNVDRTRLNPNMMIWNGEVWLIDHGASLYFHHSGKTPEAAAADPFPYIKDHIMLPYASRLEEADKLMRQAITPRTLSKIVDLIPDEWLAEKREALYGDNFTNDIEADFPSPSLRREIYRKFLTLRLADTAPLVREAVAAREKLSRHG